MIADTQSSRALAVRRALLVGPSLALMIVLAVLAGQVFAAGPRGPLDAILLGLFVLVMSWECFVVWQLCLGFASWLAGPRALTDLERRAAEIEPVDTGLSRTAVLIPVYDEDADAVFAGVRVMARSIRATGAVDDIDIHVLSDTRDPDVAAAEERAYAAFSSWAAEGGTPYPRVHYRRRAQNVGRKAGNIAEWMERCGDAYDFMIVLDADSLMAGATMRRLIGLMEENPHTGIIQTVSYATGRQTLFARIQQFAVRLYAPLALRGLEFWQGPEGSYWGHNAILRVAPFREHARLPILPGRPPFGGEILCHDTVEAALLRRAGWSVRLLPEIDGTWEEMPTNVMDLMGRERRWCQGNLQHIGVLGLPGLKGASRAHIALGIGGYLTAPLWWAFLLLATLRAVLDADGRELGVLAYGLTESGPVAWGLFALCAALILLPRVLNLGRALAEREARRSFGGTGRFLLGAGLEQAFWILLGPVLALINAGFVLTTCLGRVVRWEAQPRADRTVPRSEAWRRLGWVTGLGCLLMLASLAVGGWFGLWLFPTALGLVLAPALACLSSRIDLGLASRRLGLFLTGDDTVSAPELIDLRQFTGAPTPAPAKTHDPEPIAWAPPDGVGAEERS